MAVPIPDFAARVKQLAAERGMSVAQVGYDAYDRNVRGTNPDTFKSVMAGRRTVTPALIEAVARALQLPPEEFAEYRLAKARAELDEREVGLDQALGNLERLEAAMRRRPSAAGSRASEPAEASPQPRRAGRSAGESRSEG